MPPFATIYTTTNFLHARVAKSLAAANLNSLEISIAPDFVYGETNKTPEYLAKFPHGKLPALETSSGFYLSESTAIALYLAESGPYKDQLVGRTTEERALVQMWISLSDNELFANANPVLGLIFGRSEYIPGVTDKREEEYVRALNRVEWQLSQEGKVWLVTDDEFSLADLSVAAALYWPLRFFMDGDYRQKYPKIMEWWENLMAVEQVGKGFNAPVEFCRERPSIDGKFAKKA